MKMGKKYFATVSYPPNKQACYVRLKVSRPGMDIPLSIKATFGRFQRHLFTEGTIVFVTRSDHEDATKYQVTSVFENNGNALRDVTDIRAEYPHIIADAVAPRKGKMSPDRIQFFLPRVYFQANTGSRNGMQRATCISVLSKAFGPPESSWASIMQDYPEGFIIRCRPSQFARFIVFRHEAGECINGIKDLNPHILIPTPPETVYEKVTRELEGVVNRTHVYQVLQQAGLLDKEVAPDVSLFDVSKNPHDHFTNEVKYNNGGIGSGS